MIRQFKVLVFAFLLAACTTVPLRNQLADLACLAGLICFECAQIGFHGGGRGQGLADEVVDHLGGDVLRGAGHDQARTLGGAGDLAANPAVTVLDWNPETNEYRSLLRRDSRSPLAWSLT